MNYKMREDSSEWFIIIADDGWLVEVNVEVNAQPLETECQSLTA